MYMNTKYFYPIIISVIIILGAFLYFFTQSNNETYIIEAPVPTTPTATDEPMTETDTPTSTEADLVRGPQSNLGTSAGGETITAYHFGSGDTELLFVGGIHGGYSWNTALVAFELIDHLTKNPTLVPENVTVTVIPVLNPDGLKATVGTTGRFTPAQVPVAEATRIAGRFNANTVDLNRNFDCQWSASATWQERTVSGGSRAFSEPEAQAIRDYVGDHRPSAVVVWYSAAGGVYASSCNNGVLPQTTTLVKTYADASKYPSYNEFNYYEITGDMVNWMAKLGIPAISVLLTDHVSTEWEKNRAGIEAVIANYTE
jgi:hypothetical protein